MKYYNMANSRFLILGLLCLSSTYLSGLCMVRRPCLVMERQYFETYGYLVFYHCDDFLQVNFTIAAYCPLDKYNQHSLLEDVPVETDWLCMDSISYSVTIKADIFSRLRNLKSLYIFGFFTLLPGSFESLTQLTTLWLYPNNYTIDGKLDFGNLTCLEELNLHEILFSDINLSTFKYVKKLKRVVLAHNEINSFSSVTKHLTTMKHLRSLTIKNEITELRKEDCLSDDLSGNRNLKFRVDFLSLGQFEINQLENNSLCNFPKLSFLEINIDPLIFKSIFYSGVKTADTMSFSTIQFVTMEICVYASHFKVKELHLMDTYLENIDTTKGSCSTLKILDLSFNFIEEVSFSQIKKFKNLTNLNLSNNQIKALSVCPLKNSTSAEMALVYLNISFNFLTSFKEKQFACLKSLRVLDLDSNQIHNIKMCSFCGLEKLEVLNLQNNHIYMIQEYSFSGLFSLKQLNLHDNQLTEINDWAFYDLKQLEEIVLTFTYNLEEMWWSKCFASTLKKLSLKTMNTYIMLLHNHFKLFYHLEALVIDSQHIYIDMCDDFPYFLIRELHLLNNIHFMCLDFSSEILGKFVNVEKLYYSVYYGDSFAELATINTTLRYLDKLEFFCLHNTEKHVKNSLVNPYELFQGLINLKILYLINSGLGHLNSDVLFRDLKSVTSLIIENQFIEEINEKTFSPMSALKYVDLYGNSIECRCQLSWFSQWILSNKRVSFSGFYDQKCLDNSQSPNIIMTSFLEHCDLELQFTMFIVSFVMTLLFMLASLFYETILWYALYLFYTVKCWLNHRLRGDQNDQHEYDVFVSYNTVNEQWVTEELLRNLEQNGPPFFKVCIHNRDFEIGRDIVENIVDSIYKSRWTICIITRNYLQSHWCSLEMRMATYRLIAESKDSLILIFLDKISKEEIQCYHRLTKLLDKKTYLEWPDDPNGQELFWARLRKVIGSHIERNYDEL